MRPPADSLLLALRTDLVRQDGVVSRRQLLAAGLRQHDLDRLVRSRVLVPVLRGVYVDHTAAPSWRQRAWAATLAVAPAALGGESAMLAAEGREGPSDGRVPW